ncbi:sodium-dependent phosphate transporter [Lachnospiraceae bacterium KM106-2]|nr:sodium-dependent phosphate transporter [Lachnospiraceae bacterium KM106-2]
MDIFSVFTLLGGLAFFLYGMNTMSSGLEKMTGGKLEKALKRLTSNKYKSLLLGAGITIAIQSSSAMTVMLVGFVNSGIMQLHETIGVIMGSNIGTTLTAWILSMAGIKSDNVLVRLLNPESFAPIIALIGIMLMMVSKKVKKKDIGHILVGFSILMYGMTLMSNAVSPLADMPQFSHILVAFKNPLLGVLVGTVFTGIIQSSAASVGILQALSLTGSISYGMSIPIIMGQNIGTCVTALLSSIGVNKNAKRVAVVHIYFNLIGTVFCLTAFYLVNAFIHFSFIDLSVSPIAIAAIHSIFNLVTTLLLFPFTRQLEILAKKTIRNQDESIEHSFIDDRLLTTPSVAIAECRAATEKMARLVRTTLSTSEDLVYTFSQEKYEMIEENEVRIDEFEDKLGTYLVKLSGKELSESDSKEISKVLHVIGDFERIGDHALSIARVGQELDEKDMKFSDTARKEIMVMTNAVKEIIDITIQSYVEDDVMLAKKVEPLEQVIDLLKAELKDRHIDRLREGACTIEQGFIFSDLLTNYERISDHCSNIAVCVIQVSDSNFDTHEYLQRVKTLDKGLFMERYHDYREKYQLES